MIKYDKLELVKEKVNHLINEAYEICDENDIPFFSFIMAAADEEKGSVDWVSTRTVPEWIRPNETPIPDSLWSLLAISSAIIKE